MWSSPSPGFTGAAPIVWVTFPVSAELVGGTGLIASDPKALVVVYLTKFLAADLERLVLTGDVLVGKVCSIP